MRQLYLHEWKHLDIVDVLSDSDNTVTRDEADRLVAFTEKVRLKKMVSGSVLKLSHNKLKANAVVGIVQTKQCALEILPKIESKSGIEIENNAVRERLVEMIAVTHNLKIDVGNLTKLKTQNNTLLEILISMFIDKISNAIKQGLTQRYINSEEDLSTLKGTLNLTRQFTIHATDSSKLACRFDLLSIDIPLNQVLKATIGFLQHLTRNMKNRQFLKNLFTIFADVSDVPLNKIRWDLITINRTNSKWKEIYSLAQLFLRKQYQTTTSGFDEGYALLFDMNKLFEEYIGRKIQKLVAKSHLGEDNNFEVNLQRGNEYCLYDIISKEHKFRTQPDITIKLNNKVVHIIDTKWKLIFQDGIDTWKGVSQADVYQMMAYGMLYKAPYLTLLYPFSMEIGDEVGLQKKGQLGNCENSHLRIFTIDVFDKKQEEEQLKKLLKCGLVRQG